MLGGHCKAGLIPGNRESIQFAMRCNDELEYKNSEGKSVRPLPSCYYSSYANALFGNAMTISRGVWTVSQSPPSSLVNSAYLVPQATQGRSEQIQIR